MYVDVCAAMGIAHEYVCVLALGIVHECAHSRWEVDVSGTYHSKHTPQVEL